MSNFHVLAANDFQRTLVVMGEDIVRRIHGDKTRVETVTAIVERDNQAAGANSSDGGLNQRSDKLQVEPAARIEMLPAQETFHDDAWEIDGDLWRQVGIAIGEDAGSKTIVVRRIKRIRGRRPNLNTDA